MKKLIYILFLFLISFNYASADYIDLYNIDIELNRDNSAIITETISYNFSGNYRHGIYRNIPMNFRAKANINRLDIDVISVENYLGESIPFKNESANRIDLKIGDPNEYVEPNEIYVIKYKVQNLIGFFDSHDELYWNLIGDVWDVDSITNVNAKIMFPQNIERNIGTYSYCGPVGSNQSCGEFYLSKDKVIFSFKDFLISGEAITIDLEFNKGIIDEPTFLENLIALFFKYLPFLISFVLATYIFKKTFRQSIRTSREYKKFRNSNPLLVQYIPENYSVIEASFFHDGFSSHQSRDIAAVIVSLAVDRYIKIIQREGDYYFEKLPKTDSLKDNNKKDFILELTNKKIRKKKNISIIMDKDSGKDDSVSYLENDKFREASKKIFNDSVEKIVNEGYLNSETVNKFNKKTKRKGSPYRDKIVLDYFNYINFKKYLYVFILFFLSINPGGLIFMFGSTLGFDLYGLIPSMVLILIAIYILFFIKPIPGYTEKGFKASWFVDGLYEYINMSEKERIKFLNAPKVTPDIFNKLLPYAMVFGLEKKWTENFSIKFNNEKLYWMNDDTGSIVGISSVSSFSNAINSSAKSTFGSSSGGFSGGGSSGGGGGGGGGGSW